MTDGAWSILAASRRGRLHAHRGDHREDAIALRPHATGWCGAVADGAGSAPWSRIGAQVATHVWCTAVAAGTGPLEARARAAAITTRDVMCALASRLDIPPRALRTTLLAVAVDEDTVLTMQVGDGGLVLIGADDRVSLPQAGDAGEFSGEVTHFLPDDGSAERLVASLHATPVGAVRAILLASDGIEDPWYPLTRHATLLAETLERGVSDQLASAVSAANSVQLAWRGPVCDATDAEAALAEWMGFEKRGENDDRSLLFARVARR